MATSRRCVAVSGSGCYGFVVNHSVAHCFNLSLILIVGLLLRTLCEDKLSESDYC